MRIRPALRDALRSLGRRPAFATLIVGTLAIGIGTTTAMFSVIDTLLIRPLPFPHAERLVEIWSRTPAEARGSARFTSAAVRALRSATDIFAGVEGYQFNAGTITSDGEPRIVASPQVSAGLLTLLGVTPRLGRVFNEDDAASVTPVAMISEGLWRGRYGSDSAVLGRSLVMDGRSHIIVGVLPSQFRFPEARSEVWRLLPTHLEALPMPGPGVGPLQTIAILNAGVSRELAEQRLLALTPAFQQAQYIASGRSLSTGELLQKTSIGRYRNPLYLMFGAVALVLLVACVNVTNLLLARASLREGEFAMLSALGSSRSGVATQMFVEGLLLGLLGGVGGAVLAKGALMAVLAILPPQMTYLAGVTAAMDFRVLLFAFGISVTTCVAVSLIPAWRASRVDLVTVLSRRAASVAGGRDERWQSLLVTAQLATAVVLLAGAGLLATSFVRLVSVDLGFAPNNLVVFDLQFSSPRYAQPGSTLAFVRELDRFVEEEGASLRSTYSMGVPPGGGAIQFDPIEIEGRFSLDTHGVEWVYSYVADDYLQVLQVPLLQGRMFTREESAPVMVINDVMARRFWGDRSPLGDRIRLNPKEPWITIIGVAKDVKQMGFDDAIGDGMEMYLPYQTGSTNRFFNLSVRSAAAAIDIVRRVKARIREMDPDLPVTVQSMEERFAESVWRPRFFVRLAIVFAVIAVVLASIGVYSTAAYWVVRRRRELGVRMALGATRPQLMSMIVGRGLAMAAIGGGLGLVASVAGARIVESMLFATSPRDPVALLGATFLLAASVVVGCVVPAFRAACTDPVTVLRTE
jgi:putative ABC transport system permease protein